MMVEQPLLLENCCDGESALHAQAHLITDADANRMAEVFKAIADPNRVRIIAALDETELCVHDLALVVGMTQSAVSHQLRLLRAMGLVSNRREGRMMYYQLDDDHVRDLFERTLAHIQHS